VIDIVLQKAAGNPFFMVPYVMVRRAMISVDLLESLWHYLLFHAIVIALLAFAMGVRNATVRLIGVPDLTTTVLTMTLTGLAADSPAAGGSGKGSVRRLAAVVAMLAGALAGALLLKTSLVLPLVATTALVMVTWLVYVPAARRAIT